MLAIKKQSDRMWLSASVNPLSRVSKKMQAKKYGQGNFNDADMLEIGNVGLTETEQTSMMSLWCIASAPLLAGTDIIHASAATLKILANREVTAINQVFSCAFTFKRSITESSWLLYVTCGSLSSHFKTSQDLGKDGAIQGILVSTDGDSEIWAKWLADRKSVAVLLLNTGSNATTITAKFVDLKLTGTAAVRFRLISTRSVPLCA